MHSLNKIRHKKKIGNYFIGWIKGFISAGNPMGHATLFFH